MKKMQHFFDRLDKTIEQAVPEQWEAIARRAVLPQPTPVHRVCGRWAVLAASAVAVIAAVAVTVSGVQQSRLPAVAPDDAAGMTTTTATALLVVPDPTESEQTTVPNIATMPDRTADEPSVTDTSESMPPSQGKTATEPNNTTMPSSVVTLPPVEHPTENAIVVNEIQNGVSACKLWFDPAAMYTETWTMAQVLDYWGVDLRPTVLPNGVFDHSGDSFEMWFYNSGKTLYDSAEMRYTENRDDPEYGKTLLAQYIRNSSLFDDVVYMFDQEMQPSTIRGVEVMLGHRENGIYDGTPTPVGYYDMYVARFSYNGVSVQMVSENFTLDEFIAAVESVFP